MKKLVQLFTLVSLVAVSAAGRAQAGLEKDPAYLAIDQAIDFKAIPPQVNVNLPRFLLQDAFAEMNGGPDDPFAAAGVNLADLVKDIKLIRVVVIEANTNNRAALTKGVAQLRSTLESKWTPITTVPEENVGIYALGDPSGETMAGLALLIHDDGDVVIGNIVGRVSLGKIIKLASKMDKFPKDLLGKLAGAPGAKPEEKQKPTENKAEAK